MLDPFYKNVRYNWSEVYLQPVWLVYGSLGCTNQENWIKQIMHSLTMNNHIMRNSLYIMYPMTKYNKKIVPNAYLHSIF